MIRTEEMLLNVGPQHPSTHGVFRLVVKIDGEIITEAIPVIGYLHRGTEKLAEDLQYTQIIPYTDRLDYLSISQNELNIYVYWQWNLEESQVIWFGGVHIYWTLVQLARFYMHSENEK